MQESLWGEEFNIPTTQESVKKVLKKVKEKTDEQKIKSKLTSLDDKIKIIAEKVYKTLGHYKDQMLVIRDRETLHNYITKSIENNIIAIDTETNNSLDPITCKLMGVCIYTPGEKNVYIPINHINRNTKERLPDQLTELDIKEEFERLHSTRILMHNGKFDYKVIKCTCSVDLDIYWDTMAGARLLNENEPSAGLKQQFIDKIDPNQAKYKLEELFEGLEYALFDPELFAYYASTDAYMTYKLYEYQVEAFKDPDLVGVKWVFDNIEIPIIKVVANMELTGIDIDQEYASRLSKKYNTLLEECSKKVDKELNNYSKIIAEWRLTPQANFRPLKKKGEGFGKSKNEQLADPIGVDSPTQLAILLYDILKISPVSKDKPRGTGVEELEAISKMKKYPLVDILLEKRKLNKLLNTFIDKLPNDLNPKTGKIHCEFLSLGTDTGRFSSKNPNLQQIPRANIQIKPMFMVPPEAEKIIDIEDKLDLFKYETVNTNRGWIRAEELNLRDYIITEDNERLYIENIEDKGYILTFTLMEVI